MSVSSERRLRERLEVHGRLEGQYSNGGVHRVSGVSKNLSAGGMFAYVEGEVAEGSYIELVLEIPSQDAPGQSVRMRCVGRVVRRDEPTADGLQGIAVEFENMEIVGES
jgi:c-di-GMP-binding flagellar brake protein YcgR